MRTLFLNKSASLSFPFHQGTPIYPPQKKLNSKIESDFNQIRSTRHLGLKAVLKNDPRPYVDQTFLEIEDLIADNSSLKSESNSLTTGVSSDGALSIMSRQGSFGCMNCSKNENKKQEKSDIFDEYYRSLRASLQKSILKKKPDVYFADVAGNTYSKETLKEAFALGKSPENVSKGWKTFLLYGPPGVGKTMMAQAVCNESEATPLWVSLSDITSKFTGESEKLLRIVFDLARENAPSVIILEEMDSIGRKRTGEESETERRIKTEFLRQLDEINEAQELVYVIATTNMPWELDIAVIRRFERRLLLPLPDQTARVQIVRRLLGLHQDKISQKEFKQIGEQTSGYSGSDLKNVVKETLIRNSRASASSQAIIEDAVESTGFDGAKITIEEKPNKESLFMDVVAAIKNCKATVSLSFLEMYQKFLAKYGHEEQREELLRILPRKIDSYYL